MNNFNTFKTIFNELITEKDISSIYQAHNFVDSARKFTAVDIMNFFAKAAILRWKGFINHPVFL